MLGPLFAMPIVMSYQYDLVYGNKSDRVRDIFHHILVSSEPFFIEIQIE